jgi:transcriptional regulator with XRE-family HTH domain
LAQGESSAVARRRLRLALREAREAKGFTQGQVARNLDWSLSKVQRIESGEVTVSSTDLKAFLADVGIADAQRISYLVDLARLAKSRRGFWEEAKFRQHLTPSMRKLFQFESEASAYRSFQTTFLPGLLQTRAYAEYILGLWGEELDEDVRAIRLEARLRRREGMLNRPDPAKYLIVIDESVLHRMVGGVAIMAEQFQFLLSDMSRPNVTVRILPFGIGVILATTNPFTILDLGGEENAVIYREAQLMDDIDESPERTKQYRGYFERVWDASWSEDVTARKIDARAAGLLSELDLQELGRG